MRIKRTASIPEAAAKRQVDGSWDSESHGDVDLQGLSNRGMALTMPGLLHLKVVAEASSVTRCKKGSTYNE